MNKVYRLKYNFKLVRFDDYPPNKYNNLDDNAIIECKKYNQAEIQIQSSFNDIYTNLDKFEPLVNLFNYTSNQQKV